MSVSHSLVWKRPGLAQSTQTTAAQADDGEFRRKKLKLNDLPIASAKRTAIDGLLLTFKKSGEFDKLRKGIFNQFEISDAKAKMMNSIEELTEREIERQANYLLSKDRRQAAALIEGAVERSTTYKLVDSKIEELVQGIITEAENSLRKARENEIGEDAALEELKRGGKTDDEYLHTFAERKQARMRIIDQENAAIKKQEDEIKRKREEEKKRQKEEEEAREREQEEKREKEREEREERRRKEREEREKEREKEREREREREKELEKEREERRERRRREDEERRRHDDSRDRSRTRDRSRERRRRNASRERSRRRSPDIYRGRRYSDDRGSKVLNASEKDIEAIALEELLQEGKKAAAPLALSKAEPEESLEPPPRKMLAPKSIVPRDPMAARLSKLDSPKPSTSIKLEERSRAGSIIPSIEKETDKEPGEKKRTSSRKGDRRPSRRYSPSPDRRGLRRYDDDDRGQYRPRRSRSNSYRPSSRRDASRSRSRDRRRRDRTRSRSRSLVRRRRDRSESRPRRRERSASKDALDIDRYVPSTSRRSPIRASRRDRDREDRLRDTGRDNRRRDRSAESRRRSRTRSRSQVDRDRRRRAATPDEREDSREPGGRNTRHRYAPDEIDRYVPNTVQREDLKEFTKRDRSRERSATREKTPDRRRSIRERSKSPVRRERDRSRVRDRSRSRDRRGSYDRRDRSRDRKGEDRYRGTRDREEREDRIRGGRRRSRSPSNAATVDDKKDRSERKESSARAPPPATGSKMYAAAGAPLATPAPAPAGAVPNKLHFTSLTWKKMS